MLMSDSVFGHYGLVLKPDPDRPEAFVLGRDLVVRLLTPPEDLMQFTWTTVPRGFQTDLASVPRLFTWLIPKHGKYSIAAVVHDYRLSRVGEKWFETNGTERTELLFSRRHADRIFRLVMIDSGVARWRCSLMYYAVRLKSIWVTLLRRETHATNRGKRT